MSENYGCRSQHEDLSATLLLRGTLTWCSKFYLLNKLPAREHGHNYQNCLKLREMEVRSSGRKDKEYI